MSTVPPLIKTDREYLEAFARRRDNAELRPFIERYLPLVYASALRRTGNDAHAVDVTRAVFLVFARRARKLRKRTAVAGWLFEVTGLTCRKLKRERVIRWRLLSRKKAEAAPDAPIWTRIAPFIDGALDRLPRRQRNAVLQLAFLNHRPEFAAEILRTHQHRVERRTARGFKKLAARVHRRGVDLEGHSLEQPCRRNGCAEIIPESLVDEVVLAIEQTGGKRPSLKLARRTLNSLAWRRWRRRFVIGFPVLIALFIATVGTAWYVDSLTGHSRLLSAFLVWSVKHEARTVPGLAQAARPWPTDPSVTRLNASLVRNSRDLYLTTNIWLAHLAFSREQWKALEPKRIGALPNFLQSDGTALLRNPKAQRSGLAGVLGFDFQWTHADLEFGGVSFTNVAARIKGNGTYLGSLYGEKRAFKVDLNKFSKGQKLGTIEELTFNNLVVDHSFVSDALGYEFFRDANVPAPRTAYVWLAISVEGKWHRKPLGLYALVEPVDSAFVNERIAKKTAIFKPVTYQLFEHLGDDWAAYAPIYDLKTHATAEQQRRVIQFARLVSFADDSEFAARLGEFLDLDEFAGFMAGEVLLSAYDGIFSTGQNFYVYLDPRSNKFGFIPWDLDLAWGNFFLLGTPRQQEQANIWHPWVGENRFLERVFAAEEFRRLYRARLEDFLRRLFVPDRLKQRVDALAAVVRSPVAAESDFRLDKFDQALGNKPVQPSRGDGQGADRRAHRIKRFIDKRAISVREQLDGQSNGVIMQRSGRK